MSSLLSFPLRTGARQWCIAVINGANMSNLVHRDPARFGPAQTLEALEQGIVATGAVLGMTVQCVHSNYDGEMLEWLHAHAYGDEFDGILINPAGWTNYAEHIRHCLEESRLPYIEVHYANIAVTGHPSVFTRTAVGVCHGFRKHSYSAALVAMASILDDEDFPKPARRR
jgi:3-dehydroquinate dehydratase II